MNQHRPQARPYIYDLQPYSPGTPIEVVARQHGIGPDEIIKLASNENPAGMSPRAAKAVKASLTGAHRYPDAYALVESLSQKHAVRAGQVVLGNGSVDLLNMIAMAYLDEKTSAVSSDYAFAIYRLVTQAVGAENIVVPATDYGHDLSAMIEAIRDDTKVIWLANPNNPTGTFVPYDIVRRSLEDIPSDVLVVLDEAYYDYLPEAERSDTATWLQDYQNLIILRTFSKIYGMAGMRLGYALTSEDIADILNRVRMPFNASVPALAGAVAALQDEAFVTSSAETNASGKSYLLDAMRELRLECLPAYGNFITVNVGEAASVYERLEQRGVIVRPLGGYGMPEWIRVSVGLDHENKAFTKALSDVLVAD